MELPRTEIDSGGDTNLQQNEQLLMSEDDLQEVITGPNQDETDIYSIESDPSCDIDTGDATMDALYISVWRNDVTGVAELLKLPNDIPERVSRWRSNVDSRYPFLWEYLDKEIEILKRESRRELVPHLNMTVPVCNPAMEILKGNWTLLHLASSFAHHSVVYLLLLAGANAFARDSLSRTAVDVVGINEKITEFIEVPGVWDATDELNRIDERSIAMRIFLRLRVPFELSMLQWDPTMYSLLLTEIYSIGRKDTSLVMRLLDAGALSNGHEAWRAIHVLVEKRDEIELKIMLSSRNRSKFKNLLLCVAAKAGWIDGVRLALLVGADILKDESTPDGSLNALVISVIYYKHPDILKLLLLVAKHQPTEDENYSELSKSFPRAPKALGPRRSYFEKLHRYIVSLTDIINSKYDSHRTLISYAAQNDNLDCFKILLESNAALVCNELHYAAENTSIEMAQLIIKHDKSTVQAKEWDGRQPIHIACSSSNRKDMIELLLQNGADLSCKDKSGITPIDIITYNFTNPTEFMEEIFDEYITCNQDEDDNKKYHIDFKILGVNSDGASDLDVVEALIKADQAVLLTHPLIESFLYLKWKSLSIFFYMACMFHVLFVIALNIFVVPLYYCRDRNEELPLYYYNSTFWIFIIFITIIIIVEQGFSRIQSLRDLWQWETGLKYVTMFISISLPFVLSVDSASSELTRTFATVAVISSWMRLAVLASRFTSWGYYMLMFGRVAYKVVKVLLIFSCPIIGFSLGFMIQFRSQEPFDNPLAAFVKTFVMMNSEFDYGTLFNTTTETTGPAEKHYSILTPRVVFLTFVILISIVLTNLLVGVAINDIRELEKDGNIRKLQKQVEFLASLETSFFAKYYKVQPRNIQRTVLLCFNEIRGRFDYNSILPAHLREAIVKKLKIRKIKTDKELMDKDYKRKISEMHATLEMYKLKLDRLEDGIMKIIERN